MYKENIEKLNSNETAFKRIKREHARLKGQNKLFKKLIEKTNSIIFIYDYLKEKILWITESCYFNQTFGKEYLQIINIYGGKFIDKIHPDDKTILIYKSIFFRENTDNKLTIIFRLKSNDDNYKWLYLKMVHLLDSEKQSEHKCLCYLTEFNENFYSLQQINEFNQNFIKEKQNKLNLKLTDTEMRICKYLAKGKSRKEIQEMEGYKDISSVNNIIKYCFNKTGAKNTTNLIYMLTYYGFLS